MRYLLFLNKCWGVDHLLFRRLEKENIKYEYISISEKCPSNYKELYTKYKIKTTPVLVTLDNDEIADKLQTVDEIVEFLKNAQNTEI